MSASNLAVMKRWSAIGLITSHRAFVGSDGETVATQPSNVRFGSKRTLINQRGCDGPLCGNGGIVDRNENHPRCAPATADQAPGIGNTGITSTASPGKIAKCGWFSKSFAAASFDSARTTVKAPMSLLMSSMPR